MKGLSVQIMTRLLTKPYRRGAETLEIPLGADAGGWTDIASYNFNEYKARYQADPPAPKYVLFTKKDVGSDGVTIEIKFTWGGVEQTTSLQIPSRTFAATSFAVPLPPGADATLQLRRFRQLPISLPGAGADNWGIVALLGNTAKLTWVIGWEKDHIGRHLQDIQQQRRRALAHGFSLDKLGEDLRVPRFPPRPYSFDASTLALYHLNDVPQAGESEAEVVFDETLSFDSPGHVGRNSGAQSRATGKFGFGFRFPDADDPAFIRIDDASDFPIPIDSDFTVELFLKVDAPSTPPSSGTHTVIAKGNLAADGQLSEVGWCLSMLDDCRGFANNVKWAVRTTRATGEVGLFADLDIADGRFHHLAGVIDRANKRARLYVDGAERATADISALGEVTNLRNIFIGDQSPDRRLVGVVDEVRLSKVARTDFHPVLGENDDAYRQRLGIFERWLLPTFEVLLQTINNLVQINGATDSFVLIEKDRPGANASKLVRILPDTLLPGQSIDRQGNLRSKEIEVSGVPAEEADFEEIYLLRHDRPNVTYGASENNRRMQAATKNALNALLDLLAAITQSNLIIDKSFDPNDAGLHRVGRALRLRHEDLDLELLAVQAHRAGFDFVRNENTHVYASVSAGEKLEIVIEPRPAAETPAAGIDVLIDKAIYLQIAPESLPGSGQIKWMLIPCGSGRAHFEVYEQTALSADMTKSKTQITVASASGFPSNPPFKIRIDEEIMVVTAMAATTWTVTRGADGTTKAPHANDALITLALRTPVTSRPHLRLIAEAPGEIIVRVEYTLQRRTVIGTRKIRIGIENLENDQAIAGNGEIRAIRNDKEKELEAFEKDVVGNLYEEINPIYLITHVPSNKKMQIALEKPLRRLLEILGGVANGLQILKAYDPADAGLHRVGRAMRCQHDTIDADNLGALAHQAGFDFVYRQGNEIYCSVAAGEKIEIVPEPATTSLVNAITAADTTIQVTSIANFPSSSPFQIRIEDEMMIVTAMSATTWTVTRGVEATTAVAHVSGATVTLVSSSHNDLFVSQSVNLRVRLEKLPVALDGLPVLLLFSIGVGFETDLNNLVISAGLRTEFVNNGIMLGANPKLSIEQPALKWKIVDNGITYILKKEAGAINVYTPAGNYNWSLDQIGYGRGAFDFVLRPQVKFTPRELGLLLLNVAYLEAEAQRTFPYTFEIRLKPELDVPATIIPKHQYDLIMNILNYFHPIGVEVVTQNIREHVVEVKENLLNAFPGYTYPDFRI